MTKLKCYQKTYQYTPSFIRHAHITALRVDLDVLNEHLKKIITQWHQNPQHHPINTAVIRKGHHINIATDNQTDPLNEPVDVCLYAQQLDAIELKNLNALLDNFTYEQTQYRGERALTTTTNLKYVQEDGLSIEILD